ncbi:hypothetical protein BDZ88DRAFT_421001 [Geranomyces variabilis]|nr:hypothetical protein BDZ88DRAFT_421001 [Geranomyces variabilis]
MSFAVAGLVIVMHRHSDHLWCLLPFVCLRKSLCLCTGTSAQRGLPRYKQRPRRTACNLICLRRNTVKIEYLKSGAEEV